MNDTFLSFLAQRGATVAEGTVRDFGDAPAELAATASASVLTPLGQFGVLAFAGEDARDFLQRQLSCDVEALADDVGAYGAYCTPKGRVLANFLLWREPDALCMLLPRSVLPGIRKRLQTYVLRSKVTIADRTADLVALGASGPEAAAAVASLLGTRSPTRFHVARRDAVAAIALDAARFVVIAPSGSGPEVWERLSGALRPVGAPCWDWLEISNGLPWITAATQDEFVPQMANLELLGGVSFRKGCYPGQEIVARTQHLGTPRRRLYRAHVRADRIPVPSQPLYGDGPADQAAGMVVNAAPAPDGGFDLLAVVRTASAAGGRVRLGSPTGSELQFRDLPYAVPS